MLKGFEDAFTDAQARAVSLFLELLENANVTADKLYIYMFQNEVQHFFNAFLEKTDKIYSLHELFSYDEIDEFFDCGLEDIENIIEVCDTYDSKCPNEFRLIYNINTKAFDSEYRYEDFISDDCDVVDVFENWQKECNDKLIS